MHPRKRLQKIHDELDSLVADKQWWNNNRLDAPPIDCEEDQVSLALAKQAIAEWDRGDIPQSCETMKQLFETGTK